MHSEIRVCGADVDDDRLVTCRAFGHAVLSWEADGDGCICADLPGVRTAMRLRDDKRDSCGTVKTLYNDAGHTADRIVILMVLLYVESRVRLISRKKEAGACI